MMSLFRRFLSSPRTIGSLAPSSRRLASAMLETVGNKTPIFEIGAGAGAISRLICERAPGILIVLFEQDRVLADKLRRHLADAVVIEGYFHQTINEVHEIPERLVLVSSLPFKSLPPELCASTVAALSSILAKSPDRRLIQYTYLKGPPFVPQHEDLQWRRLTRVWVNFPPATVWELSLRQPARRQDEAVLRPLSA